MKVGFTCSTFDLLHAGHVQMLREAKEQCDYLICGLQVDPSNDRPKTLQEKIFVDAAILIYILTNVTIALVQAIYENE